MTPSVTQAVEDLCRAAVRLPDQAMDRLWVWGAYDEEGLRFALLMTHHELRDLAVRLAAARERAGRPLGERERIRAQYQQAYRDLTGLLRRVRDDELDREPAPGEWAIREVVRHMLGALYGWRRPSSGSATRRARRSASCASSTARWRTSSPRRSTASRSPSARASRPGSRRA